MDLLLVILLELAAIVFAILMIVLAIRMFFKK